MSLLKLAACKLPLLRCTSRDIDTCFLEYFRSYFRTLMAPLALVGVALAALAICTGVGLLGSMSVRRTKALTFSSGGTAISVRKEE